MSKKIKVLYIAGLGHSGSTLIDLILGSSKNAFSLGEIEFFEDYYFERKKLKNVCHPSNNCLCGKNLKKCKFWSPIINDDRINSLFPYIPLKGERKKMVFNTFFGVPKISFGKFSDEEFYKDILIQANKIKNNNVDILIDSSKDFRRLSYLSKLKSIDLHVIHLVRDSRGVVSSNIKWNNRWHYALFYWFFMNCLFKLFIRKNIPKSKSLMLSYDMFAMQPDKYLKILVDKFGLDINLDTYINDVNKEKFHQVGGNPINFKKIDRIKYDRSWKKRLPVWMKVFVTITTYIPNKLWVYKK